MWKRKKTTQSKFERWLVAYKKRRGENLSTAFTEIDQWTQQMLEDMGELRMAKKIQDMSFVELLVVERKLLRFHAKYVRRI